MSNGHTEEYRLTQVEDKLRDHEAECKTRAEKNEKRFDTIENKLTKIQTLLWVGGCLIGFGSPFITAVAIKLMFGG